MNGGTMDEPTRRALASGAATVLSAAAAIPLRDELLPELSAVEAASARGYFLPDEDEWLKLRYSQYLTLRSSLLATIGEIGSLAGGSGGDWNVRTHLFAAAFAAACMLMRANRFAGGQRQRPPKSCKRFRPLPNLKQQLPVTDKEWAVALQSPTLLERFHFSQSRCRAMNLR